MKFIAAITALCIASIHVAANPAKRDVLGSSSFLCCSLTDAGYIPVDPNVPILNFALTLEHLESAFVRCEQATEQRWIEALEIFNGITQVERRLQVQKRRHVAQGPGKIEQHRGLAGNLGQLHGEPIEGVASCLRQYAPLRQSDQIVAQP